MVQNRSAYLILTDKPSSGARQEYRHASRAFAPARGAKALTFACKYGWGGMGQVSLRQRRAACEARGKKRGGDESAIRQRGFQPRCRLRRKPELWFSPHFISAAPLSRPPVGWRAALPFPLSLLPPLFRRRYYIANWIAKLSRRTENTICRHQ